MLTAVSRKGLPQCAAVPEIWLVIRSRGADRLPKVSCSQISSVTEQDLWWNFLCETTSYGTPLVNNNSSNENLVKKTVILSFRGPVHPEPVRTERPVYTWPWQKRQGEASLHLPTRIRWGCSCFLQERRVSIWQRMSLRQVLSGLLLHVSTETCT